MIETWQNKKTKKILRAMPWWEPIRPLQLDEKFFSELGDEVKALIGKRQIAKGMLVQVGWLIENEHGVWFGMDLDVKKEFKVVKEDKPE